MTCGATGWLFLPSRMPSWRPGVRGRASRTAGCPLPCCRKARRGARTPISCGVQPCRSAPMMTAGAGPCPSRGLGAGMTSNNPPLPARGRGGANHPHLGSNPVAVRIECPNIPDVTLPLPMLPTQRPLPGCCGSDRSSGCSPSPPAPVPQRTTTAAPCRRRPFLPPLITSEALFGFWGGGHRAEEPIVIALC